MPNDRAQGLRSETLRTPGWIAQRAPPENSPLNDTIKGVIGQSNDHLAGNWTYPHRAPTGRGTCVIQARGYRLDMAGWGNIKIFRESKLKVSHNLFHREENMSTDGDPTTVRLVIRSYLIHSQGILRAVLVPTQSQRRGTMMFTVVIRRRDDVDRKVLHETHLAFLQNPSHLGHGTHSLEILPSIASGYRYDRVMQLLDVKRGGE